MRTAGGLVQNAAAIDVSSLPGLDEEAVGRLAQAETIALIGVDAESLTEVEGGVEISVDLADGTQTIVIPGKTIADISLFESHAAYVTHVITSAGPRGFWENWVRAGSSPVEFQASSHDDLLIGSRGDDTLTLGGGSDEVYGAEGADRVTIDGALTVADDSFRIVDLNFAEGDTIILAGFDRERAITSFEDLREYVDAGYVTVKAWDDGSGDLDVTFSGLDAGLAEADNIITGSKGQDVLHGFGGDDVISSGNGDDRLFGGAGDDRLDGGNGADAILGGDGADILIGGNGDDTLMGGAGDDVIDGGRGNDLIDGGAGNDVLFGDLGRDTFVFAAGDGKDRITDFARGSDVIRFAGISQDEITITQVGKDVVIDYGEGDMLTLAGISQSSLGASSFEFF
ncbi:hypothetical protein OM960_20315 [Defluviimonas sp. CAU 1641]|uniref:Calcium-binding protein n=2 Tax=Defluviimonas salinarum TaxID=2992147 RepID=A0ABT3J887_9RHOB|nr:hypothetical protein [Defluviimonas salinarum]